MRKVIVAGCAAALAAGLAWAGLAAAAPSGGGGSGGMSGPTQNTGNPARDYQEGVTALRAGDYPLAVRKLRAVLRAAPDNADVNFAYALALIGNGDARDARRPLERVVRSENPPPDAYMQLGRIYLDMDRRDDAEAQRDALAAMMAACDAACSDERRAQIQAAHDSLSAALAGEPAAEAQSSWLIPDTEAGRAAYAAAVGHINAEHFEAALAALDLAEAAIGPHPDILNYRGFASRKLGRYEAALGYYRDALALDPDHLGANEYLGELYIELGRMDDAGRQLARLDALCPYGCAEREELARWIDAAAK
ncbi:MAG: tetratricopeptide repeat protein [Alphaproteobacteria bacterium]|nr:tetratricopeptide repeat protein [Alphaproteobacteria bacterium]